MCRYRGSPFSFSASRLSLLNTYYITMCVYYNIMKCVANPLNWITFVRFMRFQLYAQRPRRISTGFSVSLYIPTYFYLAKPILTATCFWRYCCTSNHEWSYQLPRIIAKYWPESQVPSFNSRLHNNPPIAIHQCVLKIIYLTVGCAAYLYSV